MRSVQTPVLVPAVPEDDLFGTLERPLLYRGLSRHVVVLEDPRGARPNYLRAASALLEVTVLDIADEPATPGDVFSEGWKGLSSLPQKHVGRGAGVTRSVRFLDDVAQAAIRAIFRQAGSATAGPA